MIDLEMLYCIGRGVNVVCYFRAFGSTPWGFDVVLYCVSEQVAKDAGLPLRTAAQAKLSSGLLKSLGDAHSIYEVTDETEIAELLLLGL